MFAPNVVSQSSRASGCAVAARKKRTMAAMLVFRSGEHASSAFPRRPAPRWSNVGGLNVTAPPTRLIPAIASVPYVLT